MSEKQKGRERHSRQETECAGKKQGSFAYQPLFGVGQEQFQVWEVRYGLGWSVIACGHLGETGSLETAKGEPNTVQNGEQVGTARPAISSQGNHRRHKEEMRLAQPGLGSSAPWQTLSQAGMLDHQ